MSIVRTIVATSVLLVPVGDPTGEPIPVPDVTVDVVGGAAVRLRHGDASRVSGDLYLLMGAPGSQRTVRVWDATPFPTDGGPVPADTVASNVAAHELATTSVGSSTQLRSFVAAPGGGPSGGLLYTLAYLDELTEQPLLGGLSVAATGELSAYGYLRPVVAIDEKLPAARFARVDVLFTSTTPSPATVGEHGARLVGLGTGGRAAGDTIADEREWDRYVEWGADRPGDGMDVVEVRHVGDVLAYLCGAGSGVACELVDALTDVELSEIGA